MELCEAIIARNYTGLNLVVQADCISMATNEPMVAKMAQAGFRSVFLGIENGSKKNLSAAGKGDIVAASKQAIENCHKYGLMVIGGLILVSPRTTRTPYGKIMSFLSNSVPMPPTARFSPPTRRQACGSNSWNRG